MKTFWVSVLPKDRADVGDGDHPQGWRLPYGRSRWNYWFTERMTPEASAFEYPVGTTL